MDEYFTSELSTTNVYAFDSVTGELSYAVMRHPPRSDSRSASSKGHVYAHSPLNPHPQTPLPGEGSGGIVEEIPTRGRQTVYFVAKLHPRASSDQEFVNALDPHIRRAKQEVLEMERLVWKLEAALMEDDDFDYECDVDDFYGEDEAFEDNHCEFDHEGAVNVSGTATDYSAASGDEESGCAFDSNTEEDSIVAEASESLSSDSSEDSVTFDPPSSSTSQLEDLAPSVTSATPLRTILPSGSTLHAANWGSSMAAGDASLPSLLQLDSSCDDASLFLDTLADGAGHGCPPTEEEPFCPACYGKPIRLLWGDEPSNESLSDLVDDLLGEDDFQFEDASTLAAAQHQADVDVPTHSPVVAADWSLGKALASLDCEAISRVGTSSSISSLFSERPLSQARAGSDGESGEEPLAEIVKKQRETPKRQCETPKRRPKTVKRRRETGSTRKGKRVTTPVVPRAGRVPASDESVEVPLSALQALRVEKKKQHRTPATSQSPGGSTLTARSTTLRHDPPPRRRKRRRDDEKEEGEISEYEADSESDPDVPLAHVLASRGRSQSRLGHGAPPAKRARFTRAVDSPRRLSRDSGRSRRSWAHRRWEERLMQRHAWAGQEGRRCMRVMSTDEDQLRKGVGKAEAVH